jgi:hypothetical protein
MAARSRLDESAWITCFPVHIQSRIRRFRESIATRGVESAGVLVISADHHHHHPYLVLALSSAAQAHDNTSPSGSSSSTGTAWRADKTLWPRINGKAATISTSTDSRGHGAARRPRGRLRAAAGSCAAGAASGGGGRSGDAPLHSLRLL